MEPEPVHGGAGPGSLISSVSQLVCRALLRLYTPTHCAGVRHSVYTPYTLNDRIPLPKAAGRTRKEITVCVAVGCCIKSHHITLRVDRKALGVD